LPIGLPNLVRELLDAWAFWLANPTFSTQTLEVDCGLKFSADVPPGWIIDCEPVADPRCLKRKNPACASVKREAEEERVQRNGDLERFNPLNRLFRTKDVKTIGASYPDQR
jgi:hypothetical protein